MAAGSQLTPAPAGQSGHETTTYTYDSAGNLLETMAPPTSNSGPNDDTYNTYNADGELATVTTGYGTSAASVTSYCYDPNGDTTAVVAPDGNTSSVATCETSSPWVVSSSSYPAQAAYQTTYSYDSAGELVSTTLPATSAAPGGITTSYSYDAQGNKLTSLDSMGVTTTYSYTPANLVASISYSNSSAPSVSYGYDADGNKTAMSDGTGSSSFVYDPFGELTSAENGTGKTVGYAYNADGEVTGITYPLPSSASWATTDTVGYGYDNADRLTSVTDFKNNTISILNTADGLPYSETLGSSQHPMVTRYDPTDSPSAIAHFSGLGSVDSIVTTYDPTDSPSAIVLENNLGTLLGFSYSDAPSGAILAETDTPSSSKSPADYNYDAQGRVTSMTPGSGSTLNYGFDASGNLTALPAGAAGTYDNAGELISSVLSGITTTYTYDADGQQLSAMQGTTTVASGAWNGAGELTAYSDSAADMSSATYDGDDLRASETSIPSGGSPTTQNFVWNTTSPTPDLLMDSRNAYIFAGSGTPAEQVNLSTGMVNCLVADSLGSVRGVVSSTGSLSASVDFDAWGNPETAGGLSSYTSFGFAGPYADPSGMIYLIGRYYDPQTGQFLSVDPMVIQTQQAYLYVGDDPVNGIDPMGLANCGWNPFCYIGSAYDKANNALNRTLSDVHQGFEGFLSGKSAQDACSNLAVGDQAFCDFGAFFGGVLGFFGDEDGVASEGDESAELGHTYHGAERAADPSRLSTEQEAQVIAHATETFTQADGAKVFVQESEGRFNVVIRNESTGEVITNLKTIDEGALERLAKGYGWIRN